MICHPTSSDSSQIVQNIEKQGTIQETKNKETKMAEEANPDGNKDQEEKKIMKRLCEEPCF